MILAAQFNLKLIQYDAVNTFVHAKLNETVFMRILDEYQKNNYILKLNKALYKLQQFPILWQQKLKNALQDQDFRKISHEFYYIT